MRQGLWEVYEVYKQVKKLLTGVSNYYTNKIKEHGAIAEGVDWNGEQSQIQRFEQLCKVIDVDAEFTINDVGCGYGALYDYIAEKHACFKYCGVDISEEMILAARKQVTQINASFVAGNMPETAADYCIASGIFNVKLNYANPDWLDYIIKSLDILNDYSSKGFSFNCLTAYSDEHKKRDYLYYADPCFLFDYCKRNYSKQVALLHDYGLWEFTILVRKEKQHE